MLPQEHYEPIQDDEPAQHHQNASHQPAIPPCEDQEADSIDQPQHDKKDGCDHGEGEDGVPPESGKGVSAG